MYFQPIILVGIREETERLILKCILTCKGSRTTKAIKKENYEKKKMKRPGKLKLPKNCTHYKTTT